ncbi:MAG: 3-hydroxybutyryl-CoA dehydrogenase, partial [Acetobacteraceae bacterium]|nr:3-hydroxybutyryl-CoA dehydrogenase [Acetobacteraceae bacterium]
MNIDVRPALAAGPMLSEAPEIAHVGVVGAGQMGNGIAHVCALAGMDVVLLDSRPEASDRALTTVARNMDRQVAKGALTAEQKGAALARVRTRADFSAFGECDLVIEAATEKEDVKRAIYLALTPHLSPGCMLASNTSSISIT